MSSPSPLLIHGGRLDAAAARYPGACLPWIDLSTGINPEPYPIDAAADADLGPLPSPTALAELEAAAAEAFALSTGAIAALPGSEVGLRLLDTIGLPGPVRVATPCYGTHLAAFGDAVPVPRASLLAGGGPGTQLLANPNNPDGERTPPAALLALARAGDPLVVDEAFADADPECSVAPLLRAGDPVLAFRSFGKFYGLAGVRLGFVMGDPDGVARIRRRLGDWPVSASAIAIGRAAYRDRAWAAATRAALRERAGRLDALLASHGHRAVGGCPLFRLIDTPAAPALFDRLARAGILARPFDGRPNWLRLGLPGTEVAWARLDRALGDG